MANMYMGGGYGANYYEADREVIRGPCGNSYSSEHSVQEYAAPAYPLGHHHHHHHHGGAYVDKVTEVVSVEANPGYYRPHHPYGGVAEVVERREEVIENCYDPLYRRF